MMDRKFNVLFICTGNSARSIFAESILSEVAGDRFTVFSAGIKPNSGLNPFVIKMLNNKGYDTAHLRSKHVSEFQTESAPALDFVFTVCDQAANEDCPVWQGQTLTAHWSTKDPTKAVGTDAEKALAFQTTYGALRACIEAFAALPIQSLDRISLQNAMDRIGQNTPDGDQ